MKIVKTHMLLFSFLLFMTGCKYFQFPGVHKINVQQGHIIKAEMIEQLEPGMTRPQVRYILGTPLVDDLFNDDRWDYHYSLLLANGRAFDRTLTVFFENNLYTHHEGKNLPKRRVESGSDSTKSKLEPDTPVPTNDN